MRFIPVLALVLAASAARAEVLDSQATGFAIRHVVSISAPPATVRQALGDPSLWWSPQHTYSGDARNLRIDLASGCFCETLPTGFVRHMTVVAVSAQELRMQGALGPLQTTGASGHLDFQLKPVDGGTELTLTYNVGGYAQGGLGAVWAQPVNRVLGEQAQRLKAYAESQVRP